MEQIKLYPIDERYKIVESNEIIREAFNYVATKRQLDLIYAIISLIDKNDNEFTEYKISFRDIAMIYNPANPDTKQVKDCVMEATNKIMDSHFQITDSDGVINKYHWIEKCRIDVENKIIIFKLSKDVQKFYLNLKENSYTIYLLKDLLALSTLFQANLFRWLACNSGFNNKVRISIEDAAYHFYGSNLSGNELVKKINTALKRINDKTCICASYEKVKSGTGSKITHLDFFIKNNYKINDDSTIKLYKAPVKRKKDMWKENIELKAEIKRLNNKLKEI